MGQEFNQVTAQHVLQKIGQLEPQQIAEVMDFIDFLAERNKGSALGQFPRETPGAGVGLELDAIQFAVVKKLGSVVLRHVYGADRPFAALLREEGLPVIGPEESPEAEGKTQNP